MAESLLSPIFNAMFSCLASPLMEKGRMICHVDGDIVALSKRLSQIRDLLADAEARQISESSVKSWLAELKDVAYDADDVLDEIAYEALRQEAEGESNNGRWSQVRGFFPSSCSCFGLKQVPFKLDIAKKIKDINERIEEIHRDRNNLNVTHTEGVGKRTSEPIHQRPFTTSILPASESKITGRVKDREEIIKWLLLDDASGGKEISVISIVGMGGLGKTTLAQLVYNDEQVWKLHFQVRAWVCVSETFDVSRLTKEIIESASTEKIDSSSLDRMQRILQEILRGKRFLIVLDDVWNEDQGAWERLAAPFRVGARGSKIIVTTRGNAVSKAMNTDYLYPLERLGDEDCLSLFLRHAFPSENPDAINQELKKIGMELVQRRCDGLPLAAKTLGGLLSSKRDLNFWQSILNSQLWSSIGDESEVIKALRVSYHHLPPHFKQCFAFCSIFPKDHEFEKDNLVQLWMAQGFIQPIPGTTFSTLEEEIGSEYFDFLLSRSFFQVEPERGHENEILYKMHDCIHDLAMLVSSDECFRIEHGKPTPSPIKGHRHRHLSFIMEKKAKTKPEDFGHLHRCKGLRTFILNYRGAIGFDISNQVIRDLNMNLRCLRVLVLKESAVIELPDSISNLKHLRCLDLSFTTIKQLPESVSSLYNLQTLNLSYCCQLCQLPKETRKLVNLKHLKLDRCLSLKSMPPEMGRLTCLQTLSKFIVGIEKGYGIGELKGLTALKGAICIEKLNNVLSNAKEAEEASLKDKPNIEQLELEWDDDCDEVGTNMQQVLEVLQPPKNIKTLSIRGYGGKNFPTWLQDEKLPNLQDLTMLLRLRNCSSFPPLVQFRKLKSLTIGGIDGVKCMGREFYGDGDQIKGFPSLEVMKIQEMHDLEEWCEPEEGAFPSLQRFVINGCPKLTKMPNNFSALKHLKIEGCHQLECLPKCPSLVELQLGDNNENLLRWVPHLTSLSTLGIYQFKELKSAPGDMLQPLVNLKDLTIRWCDELVSLLEEDEAKGAFPSLQRLVINGCPKLTKMLNNFSALKHLKIEGCHQLEFLPKCPSLVELELDDNNENLLRWVPHLTSLSTLGIHNFRELKSLPGDMLQSLVNLKDLTINQCDNLVSFLEEDDGLPPGPRSLDIWNCFNIKSLPKGLRSLTSLKDLFIDSCPQLLSMPEEGLPTSLQDLGIARCPKLSKRCRKGDGEDWAKISHIPHISIDFEIIS